MVRSGPPPPATPARRPRPLVAVGTSRTTHGAVVVGARQESEGVAARDRHGRFVLALQEGVAAGQARAGDHIDVIARNLSKGDRRRQEKQSSPESRPASK